MTFSDFAAYSTLGRAPKCARSVTIATAKFSPERASQKPQKTLAICPGRSIFTPVFIRGRWSASLVTTELPGDEQVKGPVPADSKPKVKKLLSVEDEPPSSARAEQHSAPRPSPQFKEINRHGPASPVPLAGGSRPRFVVSAASNEFRRRH